MPIFVYSTKQNNTLIRALQGPPKHSQKWVYPFSNIGATLSCTYQGRWQDSNPCPRLLPPPPHTYPVPTPLGTLLQLIHVKGKEIPSSCQPICSIGGTHTHNVLYQVQQCVCVLCTQTRNRGKRVLFYLDCCMLYIFVIDLRSNLTYSQEHLFL